MKTRLLKIIRKRYTIERIDDIASNATSIYFFTKLKFGLPFFVIYDREDDLGFHTRIVKTFTEAREKLWERILLDYGENFRHKDEKSEKVWWIKK